MRFPGISGHFRLVSPYIYLLIPTSVCPIYTFKPYKTIHFLKSLLEVVVLQKSEFDLVHFPGISGRFWLVISYIHRSTKQSCYSLLPNCSTGALIRQILKSTSCHPIHTNIFWKSTSCLLIAPLIFEKEHHALYSHHFFGIGTACQNFALYSHQYFWKKYTMLN